VVHLSLGGCRYHGGGCFHWLVVLCCRFSFCSAFQHTVSQLFSPVFFQVEMVLFYVFMPPQDTCHGDYYVFIMSCCPDVLFQYRNNEFLSLRTNTEMMKFERGNQSLP